MPYNWTHRANMVYSDTTPSPNNNNAGRWPIHGWIGIGLITVFWTLNWVLTGLRTHWAFFPLWLGFCLTVDAATLQRTGDSMLTRNRRAYLALFLYSAPAWWLFEVINWRTQNWYYLGRESFSHLEYFLWASLSFSTVMPSVFGAAELVASLTWVDRLRYGPMLRATKGILLTMFGCGWVLLALTLIWPLVFFPAVWFSLFLIFNPANVWLRNQTLWSNTARGDWRPVISLGIGCLLCGLFWEMWNFFSYPKWVYDIPFLDFMPVFEMPILGYGGYIPFALELFTLYHLLTGFSKKNTEKQQYLRFASPV